MAPHSTTDPLTAVQWSNDLHGAANPLAFLLAPARFIVADRTADSMSITLSGPRCFGAGLGPHPPLRDEWESCVLAGPDAPDHVGELARIDEWDFYTSPTRDLASDSGPEVIHDDALVETLLIRHAPHSAVWPGHREVVDWFAGRDDVGVVVAVAALVRWESGHHVLSSVATVAEARGRGFATRIVNDVIGAAHARGIEWLGLGVGHDNVIAHRVYRRAGFTLRANFSSYSTEGSHHH